MSHVYCPECGFQSPEAANYCAKCGALLGPHDAEGETTLSLSADDVSDHAEPGASHGINGPALVVRMGGGREGEAFVPGDGRTLVGRGPECEIFLDDVTVSRRHAEVLREGERLVIRDLGSLNGTFVNRRRIESATLEDDDEVQIGKYRLTFLA